MFVAGNWWNAQKTHHEITSAKGHLQDVFLDLKRTSQNGDTASLQEKLNYLPTQWTNVSVYGDIGKEVMVFEQGYREIDKK